MSTPMGWCRRYFPKGKIFSDVSVSSVDKIEKSINNRPRKVLGIRNTRGGVLSTQQKIFICCTSELQGRREMSMPTRFLRSSCVACLLIRYGRAAKSNEADKPGPKTRSFPTFRARELPASCRTLCINVYVLLLRVTHREIFGMPV